MIKIEPKFLKSSQKKFKQMISVALSDEKDAIAAEHQLPLNSLELPEWYINRVNGKKMEEEEERIEEEIYREMKRVPH